MKRNIFSKLFFPCRAYHFETRLTKEQALRILYARTEIRANFSPYRFPKNKDFVGIAIEDGFQVIPDITYSNSFRPLISVRISDSVNGSAVSVQMKLVESVSIFMIVWQSLCAFFLLLIGEGVITGQTPLSVGVFMPLILMVFGLSIMHLGFRYGATKAINRLEQLLVAEGVLI